jgi:hypothetical protein
VYLKKSPKWYPYGVSLSTTLMGRCPEKFYKEPQRCGHEEKNSLRKMRVKDIVIAYKPSIIWIVLVVIPMFPPSCKYNYNFPKDYGKTEYVCVMD